ncbi:hypothetical protein Tco_0996985 [Tanacetum coccineum]
MVAYLKKPEGSEGFHQIVDFLNASHIRHLQLADFDGISFLPTTKIFEQLSLMRYPTQTPVVDEAASTGVDVRYGGATTTDTILEVGQDLKQTKLTYGAAYTKLIKKVKKLENKVKSSQARRRARIIVSDDEDDLEDPSKQGRKIAEIDQDPAISLVQHDAEIQGRHEHDMEFDFDLDAAKDVSTAEKDVSTAKPVSTAGAAVTTASVAVSTAKDKGKAKMDESESETAQTKTKLQQEQERLGYEAAVRLQAELEEEERQRIARVHEAASSFNVEEWEDIQARVEADEELAQRLQAEEREMYTEAEQARMLVELINQRKRAILELAAGSSKRDAKEELDQESSKRQNIGESSKPAKEPKDKEEELSQEELQQMMIIVPEQGMNVEALQTNLVKERFGSTEPTNDKEREIWVELKRLFEPNIDDELWKLQKHIHDLTWKLYDSCGVHHVSTVKG